MAALVVAGIGLELVFLPEASSQVGAQTRTSRTTTASTTPYCEGGGPSCVPPTSNLSYAVEAWVDAFNARDVTGLANFYTDGAVVNWTVPDFVATGLTALNGVYDGIANVRILYGSFVGKTATLTANLTGYEETTINQDNANVSAILFMKGFSYVSGNLSISVFANQQWNYLNGQWRIARETWQFLTFYEQYPVSATTFPQWTAMKEGQNPNLVQEKSFEWHAGPYVAASVYALLVGVLGYAVIRYSRNPRAGRSSG